MGRLLLVLTLALGLLIIIGEGPERVTHAGEGKKTCKSEYPNYLTSVPSGYVYTSEASAFRSAKSKRGKIKKGKREKAKRGPCAGRKGGQHVNLRYADAGSERAGSLAGCPICRDGSNGPEVYWRWTAIY